MMSAMGIGMILLVSEDGTLAQLYPIFAALSMALVAVYLWFLVISCMSFVLLRDKKRLLRYGHGARHIQNTS
uniref:G_PROTEIN_RECEP_F3_4 domain-containing protein n=1 Tax=Ascaris lumbricoides TaxID=6252 RepID=A0A0M3HXP2_ASCLU